jgi:hypothetical protein
MEEVYLVYKTDDCHSYASRDIIGVATTKHRAVKICRAHAEKEGVEISEEQVYNLRAIKQTQGYEGDGEYQFEAIQTDTLL